MLSVPEAANKAVEYLRSLYSAADNILLEEVDSSEDSKYWNITLSYQIFEKNVLGGWAVPQKKLKVFKIDAKTGNVLSMKIREVNV
jgi:hypothetical protein